MKSMHGPALTYPVDSADALLQTNRIPRQLEVDDDATAMLKVEAFSSRVRREEDRSSSSAEVVEGRAPIASRQPAMQGARLGGELIAQMEQRVAKLGKDDDWLFDSANQTKKSLDLGLAAASGGFGGCL
jgi:hypothetical protein